MAARPEPPRGLQIRKLADRSSGDRVARYDPVTGAKKLVNPDTPGDDHEPWPLLGIQLLDDPPLRSCRVSTGMVAQGQHEGWIEVEGGEMVHRPGGPASDPWRLTHSFRQADAIVFKTVDGDVRYEVVRNPDKFVAGSDTDEVTDQIYAAGETVVDKFYDLRLVS